MLSYFHHNVFISHYETSEHTKTSSFVQNTEAVNLSVCVSKYISFKILHVTLLIKDNYYNAIPVLQTICPLTGFQWLIIQTESSQCVLHMYCNLIQCYIALYSFILVMAYLVKSPGRFNLVLPMHKVYPAINCPALSTADS